MKTFYLGIALLLNTSTSFASEVISFVVNNGASVALSEALLNMNEPGLNIVDITSEEQIMSASCRVTFFHPERSSAPAKNSVNKITCNVKKPDGASASIEYSLSEVPMEWFGAFGRPPAVTFGAPLSDRFYEAFETSAKKNQLREVENFRRHFDYVDELSQTAIRSWGAALGKNISNPNGYDDIAPVFFDCTRFSQAGKITKSFCSITAF